MTLGYDPISDAPVSDEGGFAGVPDVAGPPWLTHVRQAVVGELLDTIGFGERLDGALFHSGLDKVKTPGPPWQTRTRTNVAGPIAFEVGGGRWHGVLSPVPPVPGPPWLSEIRPTVGELLDVRGEVVRQPVPGPTPPLPFPGLLNVDVTVGELLDTIGSGRFHRPHLIDFARRQAEGRGLYRVFNAAGYEFFWTTGSPPLESDSADETNPTLPHTTAATFGDGAHYFSVKYQNGVLNSGFLPLGPNGETYLRIDVSGGAGVAGPPLAPQDVRLELAAGGVVRVVALYYETGTNRADTWAIAFTTDGSPPPTDTPDVTVPMADVAGAPGLANLINDLAAQADSTLVRVRVQSYRSSDMSYSEGSSILDATADAIGPAAPDTAESWPGSLPEEA